MLKKSISIITAITFFSGRAVKQEDSTATKALKHTANEPSLCNSWKASTLAVQGTSIGIGKLLGAGKKDENEVKNEQMKEIASIENSNSSNQ